MPYKDLEIEIRTLTEDRYEAIVRTDGDRRGREEFVLPLEGQQLDRVIALLEHRVWRSRIGSAGARELGVDSEGEEPAIDPDDLGRALYDALFRGTNARVWHDALDSALRSSSEASDPGSTGVRLKFLLHRGRADAPGPQALPWEILQRPDTGEHLARCQSTSVVRCLEASDAWRPAPITGSLRVLLVEASPTDVTPLETAIEAAEIEKALVGVAGVHVDLLPHTSFETFYREFRWGGYHVVHFMGHGGFHRETGEPGLYFEGEGGKAEFVPADTFAEHVKQPRCVWLVVLNACSSGAMHRVSARDPFTSAAAALSVLRVPAVVAMQFPISDLAAITFSRVFYDSLSHRADIDVAVTEGRLAICRKKDVASGRAGSTLEWVTPVLFLHGPSVQPFADQKDPPVASESEADTEPLRLVIRSRVGHGLAIEKEADDVLDLVEFFEGRYIRDSSAWHEKIIPKMRDFLAAGVESRRPLLLDLACHSSLAFAAGSILEPKSGVDLSVVQRGQKNHVFAVNGGDVWEGSLWSEPRSKIRSEDASDLAVAVSVTQEILRDVELYLDERGPRVRRLLDMEVPEPSHTSVASGTHALRLAQTLSRTIRHRDNAEWRGTVHLFSAAPNALLVFLGQMAPALGTVQLYEFEYDKSSQTRTYWPSFRLPRE